MAKKKYVYTFGNGKAEGNAKMKELLGGKGANLADMNLIGVPVPPGFTISTEVCAIYGDKGQDNGREMIKAEVEAAMKNCEKIMGMKFDDAENPLLMSVRSGIYLYRGMLTNKYLAENFKLPYKDLGLLIAAI